MRHEEKKRAIEEYIASRKGKATQNDVVDHMNSIQPINLRTSWMTTRALIKELEQGKRIKITRAERQGQSHRISINDTSEFNKMKEDLKRLQKQINKLKIPKAKTPSNVAEEEVIIWDLLFRLGQCKVMSFPPKDSDLLERKIIELLIAVTVKKIRSMKGI